MSHDLRRYMMIVEDAMALDDYPTRMARAKEMGYDLDAYHGTGADIAAFKSTNKGSGSREGPLGFWFTNSPEAADDFARFAARGIDGANVMPVKLRIRNPLVVSSYKDIRDLVDKFTKFERPGYMLGDSNIRMVNDKVDYEAARNWLKGQGYDGIILRNTLTDSPDGKTPIDQYVVFDPSQIRSKFAKFDPTKQDSGNVSEQKK